MNTLDLIPTTVRTVPDWIDPADAELLYGQEIDFHLPPGIRHAIQTPEMIKVSECADNYRKVTGVDTEPGPWRSSMVPHTVKAMNVFGDPWVSEVWICGVDRSAKTQVLLNALLWAKKYKRGNSYWLEPAEDDCGTNIKTKIIPMFRAAAKERGYGNLLSDRADDTGKGLIAFRHGVYLHPAHANSPRTISNFTASILLANEVDKFPLLVGPETDPINMLYKRGRDARNPKFAFGSTPAKRFIYKGMLSCRQIWTWGLRCPHCFDVIVPDDSRLVIPDGATPDDIKNGLVEVGYSCNACGTVWNESDRRDAYNNGRDVCIKGGDVMRPRTVGFHWPSLVIGLVTLRETGEAYLASKTGDLAAKRNYAHGFQAIDYVEELTSERTENHLLAYRSELPRNLAPRGTAKIGLVVDTQQDHFYYEVWAYGYQPEIRMHMLRHGIVQTFDDVAHILAEQFETVDEKKLPIAIGLIDSGGTRRGWQKHSRTVEVYAWCAANRKMVPIKGVSSAGAPISYKTIEVWPGTTKKIPGGLVRANIQVDLYKDELARLLAIQPDDPGALSFHSEIDSAFSKHFCAEVKDENGDWQHDKKKGRNDWWDCANYALALREMLKTRIGKAPAEDGEKKKKTFTQSKGVSLD